MTAIALAATFFAIESTAQVISARRGETGSFGGPSFGYGTPETYGFGSTRSVSHSYVPRHLRSAGTVIQSSDGYAGEEMILPEPIPGPTVYDQVRDGHEVFIEGDPHIGAGCDSCGVPVAGGCDTCGPCQQACLIGCPTFSFKHCEFFAGVHGFSGAPNRGFAGDARDFPAFRSGWNENQAGNFGYQFGANLGVPIPCLPHKAFSGQVGVRVATSNYGGSSFTDSERTQTFLTTGIFRRVDYGLQGGIVYDYMRDQWYYRTDLNQLRGSLSWVYPRGHECGFNFAVRGSNQTAETTTKFGTDLVYTSNQRFEPEDWYAFFYKHDFSDCTDAYGKFSAGWTGQGDGMLGTDLWAPLSDHLAVESSFTFIIPQNSDENYANNVGSKLKWQKEAWNIQFQLVWYPAGIKNHLRQYNRPLFNVADNGTFLYKY